LSDALVLIFLMLREELKNVLKSVLTPLKYKRHVLTSEIPHYMLLYQMSCVRHGQIGNGEWYSFEFVFRY
jgi:hypothetical protein